MEAIRNDEEDVCRVARKRESSSKTQETVSVSLQM